jgi:hypothetical protein
LDAQTLQNYREEDKQEFFDIEQTVRTNFVSIQNNFSNIQTNFEILFVARKADALQASPVGHASSAPNSPVKAGDLSAPSV